MISNIQSALDCTSRIVKILKMVKRYFPEIVIHALKFLKVIQFKVAKTNFKRKILNSLLHLNTIYANSFGCVFKLWPKHDITNKTSLRSHTIVWQHNSMFECSIQWFGAISMTIKSSEIVIDSLIYKML